VALTVAIVVALFAPWPWNLTALLTGVAIEAVELTWGLRLARRWRPKTGAEAMIGQLATVVAPCRPSGQVRVQGELWQARCSAGADVGDTVRIEQLDGLTLVVARTAAGAPGPRESTHQRR
jgi:membrane protein implicated in regulation of membrane protease activity